MYQCVTCEARVVDEQKKPLGDYFFCRCSAHRTVPIGFIEDIELCHWGDKMCEACAKQTNRCRTCGKDLRTWCHDCDEPISSSEDAHWCDFCEEPRCDKCADHGDYFRDCATCYASICPHHREVCENCDDWLCPDCRTRRCSDCSTKCPKCGERTCLDCCALHC